MAGFYLCSLSWKAVESFLFSPSEKQLLQFAEVVSDQLDQNDEYIDDGDKMASWPVEPIDLAKVLKSHLSQEDWYAGLTHAECDVWSQSIEGYFSDNKAYKLKSIAEPVYWNIVDEVINHHKVAGTNCLEFSMLGKRPFRYTPPKKLNMDSWMPYHSMHTPDEVLLMAEQFEAAEKACLESRHEEVPDDYEELTEAFKKLKKSGDVFLVNVDT